MIRRVICQPAVFEVCWVAVHVGRTLLLNDANGKQARDERRRDRDLVRALTAASDAGDGDHLPTGDRVRIGRPDAVLDVSQSELDRLIALIDRVPWSTGKLDAVEDTLDWLAAADKIVEPRP